MQPGPSPSTDLDLRNYVQVARRRWTVIVMVALLIPVISVLISVRREPRYAASSEVLVKRQNLAAGLSPGQVPYTDAQTAERVIETQVQLARVPDLADRVVAAAGMSGSRTAADLLDSSTVTAKPKSDILVFRVEARSSSEALSLAGFYADEFTTYRRRLDTTELDALAGGVRTQLASIDSPEGRNTPLFDDLQEKLRQIQTLQALQTSSAVVVRRPANAARVGPGPATMGAGGLLLGLLLGGGIAFLLESLDTRVRRSSEVSAILGLPLLARLPSPPAAVAKRSALVVMEEPDSLAAEAFAFLRTNLAFATVGSGAKVIMCCSAVEQEGKSTTVANLAVALARSGNRVVLVDLDYRRPTMHSFFDVPRSPGVTDVSAGTVVLDETLRRVLVGPAPDAAATTAAPTIGSTRPDRIALTLLPAGGVTHQINVDKIVGVLDRLRANADVVLVDAPPLLLVGEALALSARMDALVVVTRLNHVRRPMLEELRRAFDSAPVRPLGFVATAAAEEPGYSHYYRQGYGYAPEDGPPQGSSAPTPLPQPPLPSMSDAPGVPEPPPAPAEVPVAEPSGPSPRDTLLHSVFANGSTVGVGQTDPETATPPVVGVRPRRSWAQGGQSVLLPSPLRAEEGPPPPGGAPASPHSTEEEGEGMGG